MILREMLVDDLDQVMEIEQDLFHVPWTKEGFFTFLTRDDAMFLVVEEKEKILGYCGLLMVLDEGDITNVAVRRDRQKEGIGAFLMQSLIRLAAEREVTTIHLEVRVGNETAIRLYERMGFTRDGIRKAYYSDPVEDALLMTRHPEWKRNESRKNQQPDHTPFKGIAGSWKIEGIYVRCMFSWNRWNDASASQMVDCAYDKI